MSHLRAAFQVGGSFIELWKRQHFPYLQVEETYLVRKNRTSAMVVTALSVKELYSGEQTAARQPGIIGREDRVNFGGEQVSQVQLLEAFQETGGG